MKVSWSTYLILLLIFTFLGVFLLYPVAFIMVKTFYGKEGLCLEFLQLAWANPEYFEYTINSLKVACATTALSFVLAFPIALIIARVNCPGKWFLQGLILSPLILPPFVGAIGIKQLFAHFGSVNIFLDAIGLVPLENAIDWFSAKFFGVILLEALHLFPIFYLNLVAAIANIDPSLEEAAENLGASPMRRLLTVSLPLISPGILAGGSIVFLWSFTELGTPLMFDYNMLLPVQIFLLAGQAEENPMGFVLSLVMIIISIAFFSISRTATKQTQKVTFSRGHITKKEYNPGMLGSLAIWFGVSGVAFIGIIPHIGVIFTSLASQWTFSILPKKYTVTHYYSILQSNITDLAIKNSLIYSLCATLMSVVLGFSIAYIVVRSTLRCRNLLDMISMMPFAVPGVVIAFGYMAAFAGSPIDPFVNPFGLLVIAYVIRRLPFVVRAAYAGLQQTSVSLEEAARSLGARTIRTLWDITCPLIAANLLAGAILCFAFSMLEVSDSMILAIKEHSYPITKVIYQLVNRLGDGPFVASAMGVIGMLILTIALTSVGKVMGKRLGEVFRA